MNEKQADSKLFENSPFTLKKLTGKGGSFFVIPVNLGKVFSRENFSEEQKMFDEQRQAKLRLLLGLVTILCHLHIIVISSEWSPEQSILVTQYRARSK